MISPGMHPVIIYLLGIGVGFIGGICLTLWLVVRALQRER